MKTGEKPLFVPLMKEYFEAFERGDKESEWRAHGPRWNRETCFTGRPVVLSCGYGKARRLTGVVLWAVAVPRALAPAEAKAIFPKAKLLMEIRVKLDPRKRSKQP